MRPELKPGDRVTFINEKQSGIVTKIIGPDLVAVDIGDGFEIPTPVKELVKVVQQEKEPEPPKEKEQKTSSSPTSLLKALDHGTIAFASVPSDENAVNTGPVMFMLVNNSGIEFVFTAFASRNKSWYGLGRGVIATNGVMELGTLSRNELMDISSFLVQGHFFSDEKTETITIRKEIPVLLPGFMEKIPGLEGLNAFARFFDVHRQGTVEPDEVQLLKEKFSAKDVRDSKQSGGQSKKKHVADVDDDSILLTEKVIDLHIEELVPNPAHLSNAEMINIQLKRFHTEMNQAIRSHIKKIVFIHGVGNGTLKNNLRQELRNYPNVAFKDGDYFKFGSGATEVMIDE